MISYDGAIVQYRSMYVVQQYKVHYSRVYWWDGGSNSVQTHPNRAIFGKQSMVYIFI
jgi:hypothetical protein